MASALATWLLAGAAVWSAPPKVTSLFPAGAVRGSSVVIEAKGEFPAWPIETWASVPGVQLACEPDKGKLKLTVSPDADPGVCWIRFLNAEGASAPRPLLIGMLPDQQETEPNDAPGEFPLVSDRITIHGRLAKSGDVDGFAVALKAGQTLTAAIDAHTELGSPMDAVLQIGELVTLPRTVTTAASTDVFLLEQVDDTVGLDPRISVPIQRDGTYVVRVFAFPIEPNSTIGFAGGDSYVYRLTMTTGGFLDSALPLAARTGESLQVELFGANVSDSLRTLTLPPAPHMDARSVYHPDLASSARIEQLDTAVLYHRSDAEAPTIEVPVTISGRLARPRERHEFVFAAEKGKKLWLRVAARSLGFATDATLLVKDETGKVLAENDDTRSGRDPEVVFNPPSDGRYRLVIQDIHGHSGPRHAYRLSVSLASTEYQLTMASHAFVLAAGKTVEVPITVARQDGMVDPIELTVEGLPPGVKAEGVTSEKEGPTAKSVKLILQADATAEAFQGPLRIRGEAKASSGLKITATYEVPDMKATRTDVWLTVTKP